MPTDQLKDIEIRGVTDLDKVVVQKMKNRLVGFDNKVVPVKFLLPHRRELKDPSSGRDLDGTTEYPCIIVGPQTPVENTEYPSIVDDYSTLVEQVDDDGVVLDTFVETRGAPLWFNFPYQITLASKDYDEFRNLMVLLAERVFGVSKGARFLKVGGLNRIVTIEDRREDHQLDDGILRFYMTMQITMPIFFSPAQSYGTIKVFELQFDLDADGTVDETLTVEY